MTGVRYREDSGFEGQCEYCRTFWPLDPSFWKVESGLRRCRSCWAEYKRQKEAGRRGNEIVRAMAAQRNRERYHMNRERYNASAAAWRARNKDRIAAYNREYRERNRQATRDSARAYYAEARDVILAKKRIAYQDGKAA